ncbi:MAG: type I glyceraldehyde-3-phosphate dehydrogenase [Candidatus Kerfeldbacteria bacterium]|nr:type I glyceraldehyde-3-phosphate dehydrogenase [Candidatus Kerfeldbacteria bacterium]
MPARPIRIAINGFGRIGRNAFKVALEKPELEVVAINELGSLEVMAHLLRYDTAYGRYRRQVTYGRDWLQVDDRRIHFLSVKEPSTLPWRELAIDVVLESTGRFTNDGAAKVHLGAGAKRVIVSAPTKGGDIATYLIGVNDGDNKGDGVFSNASCTTNCVAPVTRVIHHEFGIAKATMTTVHSYTAEQNLVDGPVPPLHPDLRRARAAAENIVPTTSGAAISTGEVLPELKGKFDGYALRVPTLVVSYTDFTFLTKKRTTVKQVNEAFKRWSVRPDLQGILAYTEEPLVSSDFKGHPASAIVDLPLTKVIDGDLVKVGAWYDNEWGYSNRYVEQAIMVGRQLLGS